MEINFSGIRIPTISSSLVLISSFILFTTLNFAQDISGNIEGRISDIIGTPIPGVNISLQSESLQGIKGAITNNKGYFSIFNLPVGNYNVKISFIGYRDVTVENVQIRLGKTTYLGEIKLEQQAISLPEVTISAEKYIIDPTSTTYGGNLTSKDVENLPIDRNYQSMVSLLPQANLSYYGDGVNVGSATGFENKYFVDGVEVTDPLNGFFSTYLPYNFIKEVELKAGGYEAEFQSALGGIVNVVTNSGTNELRVSAFGYFTSNSFTEHKELGLLDPTQGDFSDYDVGFSLGGPIILDKLWFFAAYNPTYANHDVSIPGFGIGVDKTLRHSFAGKLNWLASEKLRLNLAITGDPTEREAVGRNILVPPSSLENPDVYLQDINEGGVNISLNGSYSVGQNILLEGYIAQVIRHDTGEPTTERGNDIHFEDWTTDTWAGGVGGGWDSYRDNILSKLSGSFLTDAHTIIAGVEYKVTGTNNQYDYHNINKYNDTTYVEYLGKGFQTVKQRIPSVFVQDSWKLFHNLRLLTGLRWDGQYIVGSDGKVAQEITIPIQPRIGITYIPDNEGLNKFFGSFSRYSQEFSLGNSTGLFSDQGYGYEIYYRQDPRVDKSGADTSYFQQVIFPEEEGLRGQYSDEFSLGYERIIGNNIKIGIQGVYKILQEAIDDAFVISEGRFRIGNPGRGILSDFPIPEREYTALILSIEQRNAEHFNFMASYVLSRNYGNYEGLFDAITHGEFPNENIALNNPSFAPINTTGLLPNDRTHLFKFSGSYRLSFGMIFGISFIAQSGTPLSDLAIGPGIKFFSPRGSAGRTPAIWDLNARVMYELNLLSSSTTKLILDVFHIASQYQDVDIDQFHYFFDENGNPTIPNSTYGQAYRYQQPMSVRLGMGINF